MDLVVLPELVPTSVCFTGPRIHKINPEHVPGVKTALSALIDRAVERGYDRFISGMALGVDQWAAELVLQKNLKLVAAIPFEGQTRSWSEKQVNHYRWLTFHSAEVYVIADRWGYPCSDKNQRFWAIQMLNLRNIWMVENSSLVLGQYYPGRSGGTWNCIQEAIARQRTVCAYRIGETGFDRWN